MSGIGLPAAAMPAAPIASAREQNRDGDDVDARPVPPASSELTTRDQRRPWSCSFLSMRAEARRSTSSTVNPAAVGVGEHAGDERAQPALVLARRVRLRGRGGDERADAAPRLEDAGALELGVDARDGVGVDAADRRRAGGRSAADRRAAAGRWRSPRAGRARAARRSASRRAGRWRRAPLE